MTDFHRNIYSYYRGAIQLEQEREQQLEDNTTKALINTLDYCSPQVVTTFLEWLGITAPRKAAFVLQKPTIGSEKISRKSQRFLLAIVGATNAANELICAQLPGTPVGDSRPDAWIVGEDFVLLLETKVGGSTLELNQMSCHWHKLQPTCRRIVTWAQVHKFFVTLTPELKDPKSKWLVEQLTQYLEWTGMTDFVGFSEGMFEFFVQSEKDPDTKKWVRGAVEALAERVLNGDQGLKQFNAFYEDKHVGNLGKEADHYWVAFGPANFRNHAHQTISLYEQELDVFVNVELLPAVKKLRTKIQSNAGFRKVMCQLPIPFTVRIEERRKTKTERPREFDYFTIAEVEAGIYQETPYGVKDPQSPGFDYIEALLLQTQFPYLSVRRRIARKRVLELSQPHGEALVNEVIDTLKAFHPLVEFINQ